MADDKLDTSPEENKSLGPAAPLELSDPPLRSRSKAPAIRPSMSKW